MSTAAVQSAKTLNVPQREWLVRIGALLNTPVKPAAVKDGSLAGVSPEVIWQQKQPAFTKAFSMVRALEDANLGASVALRKEIDLARDFGDQKKFAEAVQTFDALEPKIKEEYAKSQQSNGGTSASGNGAGGSAGSAKPASTPGGAASTTKDAAKTLTADDESKAGEYKKQILKVGSKGPAVEYLQKKLNATGAKLEVDGKFGPLTQAAVKVFQKSKTLKDDGIVGEKTWGALDAPAPKPDPPKPPDTKPRKAVFTVTNVGSNDAVPNAVVNLGTISEKIGNTGQATLSIPPGKYPYTVTADGFEQATGTLEVTDKDETPQRVEMKRAPSSPSRVVLLVEPVGRSKEGEKITLTATVLVTDTKIKLTGTVRFDVCLNKSTRQTLNTVPLKDGTAVHTETKIPKGSHLLDATFTPDSKAIAGSQSSQLSHEIKTPTKEEEEFQTARKAALSKFDDCMVTARSFDELKANRKKLTKDRDAMDAAAKAGDFVKGKGLAATLEKDAGDYLKEAAKKQAAFDKIGTDVKKSLDGAKDDTARAALARDLVKNKLDNTKIKFLPSDVRNQLMDALTKKLSDDDKKALNKLYRVRVLDPEFEKDDKQKTDKLIDMLKSDPEVAKARKDWKTMKPEDRIKFLQKIADYQCAAYGTTHIKGDPDFKVVAGPDDMDPDTSGEYDHSTGEFAFNFNKANPDLTNFDTALDTVVHEAGHRYQSMLAEKAEKGDLKSGDPLFNEARTFELNDKYYADDPFAVYENQPEESHSRISALRVQNAHIGK